MSDFKNSLYKLANPSATFVKYIGKVGKKPLF